jgi:protein associated with RNAse G/E
MLESDRILADKLQYDEHREKLEYNRRLSQANRQNIKESQSVVKRIQSSEYEEFIESSQARLKQLQEM